MRIRYSARDLAWLVLVAALAMSWWLDHKRMEARVADYRSEVIQLRAFALPMKDTPDGSPGP